MSTLIIGTDGKIGSALTQRLRLTGRQVLGTTRRMDNVGEDNLHLDLAEDVGEWPIPSGVETAVICAGISSVGACANDPSGTSKVNVSGTVTLAKKLLAEGAFVVFLSTGHVFDGSRPHHLSEEAFSPITEYGRQKAETERQLDKIGDNVAIVRLSNVLGPNEALLAGWAESLKKGEVVTPFEDMTMAPVPLSCVVTMLQVVTETRLPGIWQISGERDVSYADIARIGARLVGADEGLIQPVRAADVGYNERIRENTTMDVSTLKDELGIEPPGVMWTLERAFRNHVS